MSKKQLEYVRCNLCGADDYSVVYEARYDLETDKDLAKKFRSSGDEFLIDRVVKCNICGLVYVNPRLKSELIIQGYSVGSDEAFVSQAKGRELTFEKGLSLIHNYRVPPGKLLDIGTAGGSFLYVAKKRSWEVYGCEPNKWMCNWGKKHYGIDIKQGTLFDQKYKSNFFDVVTLWDVLEHTPNPNRVLKECNRILKEKGLIVVNYPDIGSLIAKVMKRKWVFLLSVHLFYFTKKTIRDMLETNGFRIIKIKPHIQTLSLGYLLFRLRKYSPALSKLGQNLALQLKIEHIQIPYWLGQTLVVAEKISEPEKVYNKFMVKR